MFNDKPAKYHILQQVKLVKGKKKHIGTISGIQMGERIKYCVKSFAIGEVTFYEDEVDTVHIEDKALVLTIN